MLQVVLGAGPFLHEYYTTNGGKGPIWPYVLAQHRRLPLVCACGIICGSERAASVFARERRTTMLKMGEEIRIQHWMVLAILFLLDVAVLGCLFLIVMNKIYLLP